MRSRVSFRLQFLRFSLLLCGLLLGAIGQAETPSEKEVSWSFAPATIIPSCRESHDAECHIPLLAIYSIGFIPEADVNAREIYSRFPVGFIYELTGDKNGRSCNSAQILKDLLREGQSVKYLAGPEARLLKVPSQFLHCFDLLGMSSTKLDRSLYLVASQGEFFGYFDCWLTEDFRRFCRVEISKAFSNSGNGVAYHVLRLGDLTSSREIEFLRFFSTATERLAVKHDELELLNFLALSSRIIGSMDVTILK